VLFRQVTHDDLGCASYLIGDENAGVAAVVDPKLDIEEYLSLARYLGVSIEHVLETHTHADHVSGHGRLAAATGATIHIHRAAAAGYEHEPFDDGWELVLGALRVRALHTPACSSATSRGRTSRSTGRTARAACSARCTPNCSRSPPRSSCGPGTWAARCAAGRGWISRSPPRSASSAHTTRR
jgi:L-ascorbate metabolism protein UlaG (beta-lactamase superfamily)